MEADRGAMRKYLLMNSGKKDKIKKKNIVNFDKAGFRIGYAKGQWILVPNNILEVRVLLTFYFIYY